jgi:hypothetical protein
MDDLFSLLLISLISFGIGLFVLGPLIRFIVGSVRTQTKSEGETEVPSYEGLKPSCKLHTWVYMRDDEGKNQYMVCSVCLRLPSSD